MADEPAPDVPIDTLKRTSNILDALKDLDGAGVSAVSERTGLPVSTVHDHVRTLETYGYVVKEDGEYRIGVRFLEFGGYARSSKEWYEFAKPEVRKLAEKTGEHANLIVEENGVGYFLYQAKGDEAVRLDTAAGQRTYLHSTALGKSILAFLTRAQVEEIVDRHGLPANTENTVTDREALFDELDEIRERGYSTEDEEYVEGMRCVAAPIRNKDGEVLGAISNSGPVSRMQGRRFNDEIPKTVLRTTNIIEVNIKHS